MNQAACCYRLDDSHALQCGMRIAPPCGEGWRRLSIVVFVIVSFCCLGEQVLSYGKVINNGQFVCANTMSAAKAECRSGKDWDSCSAKADDDYYRCFAAVTPKGRDRAEEFAVEAAIALLAGYVSLFAVRTIGWVAAGFGRSKQPT